MPERTEWHRVLLWRRQAEIVEKYVHKGDKLYVEGQLRTRNFTDKQGKTHYVTEVWAERLELLTPRADRSTEPAAPNPPTVAEPSVLPF